MRVWVVGRTVALCRGLDWACSQTLPFPVPSHPPPGPAPPQECNAAIHKKCIDKIIGRCTGTATNSRDTIVRLGPGQGPGAGPGGKGLGSPSLFPVGLTHPPVFLVPSLDLSCPVPSGVLLASCHAWGWGRVRG